MREDDAVGWGRRESQAVTVRLQAKLRRKSYIDIGLDLRCNLVHARMNYTALRLYFVTTLPALQTCS